MTIGTGEAQWAERFRLVAIRTLGDPPPTEQSEGQRRAFVEEFKDEAGHRRATDGAFLSHLLGVPCTAVADPIDRLWPTHPSFSPHDVTGLDWAGQGAFFPDATDGIEARTERELMALHAASWCERLGACRSGRTDSAASWLMEEIQPDNATNHPWGIHVFVRLGASRGDPGATLYADQMLSASQIARGRPDRLSACILLDAARWLSDAHPSPGGVV